MSLERIEITPFAVIAGEILQQRSTGALTVIQMPLRKTLYWSQGELVMATSATPEDWLPEFLVRRGVIPPERALQLVTPDPMDAVAAFHESGLLDMSARQTLLREWLMQQVVPLFSLDEGTAAFQDDEAIAPEKRVFLQSTAALLLDGVRSITNGLVLRRSLGDLSRMIEVARDARDRLEMIPLNDAERKIAESLNEPQTIENFLKQFLSDSVTAARVVIGLMALGIFVVAERRTPTAARNEAEMQRDLEMLAAIGSSDQRSLRAVALSRQLASLDHYQLLDVARGATRAQVLTAAEEKKALYDPATYPPIVREAVGAIQRRLDDALMTLRDPNRRQEYDRLLQRSTRGGDDLQRRAAQRTVSEQNFQRARQLTASGDYYGAIVLLKESLRYVPENAEAWFLLGSCQERNPRWRRDAAESFQRALSIDPNHVDALISLGDLYRNEGLAARAQSCYEDVLKIAPDHAEAKSRLAALKKR